MQMECEEWWYMPQPSDHFIFLNIWNFNMFVYNGLKNNANSLCKLLYYTVKSWVKSPILKIWSWKLYIYICNKTNKLSYDASSSSLQHRWLDFSSSFYLFFVQDHAHQSASSMVLQLSSSHLQTPQPYQVSLPFYRLHLLLSDVPDFSKFTVTFSLILKISVSSGQQTH